MGLKFGKTEVNAVALVLDQDHESVEDAARACLAVMEDIFRARAKFVVVGQLCGNRERTEVPPSDPEAIKVSLGWYSTEGEARDAGEKLWGSTVSGDRFRWWVLNVHHGTPADLHAKRKAQYVALEEKQAEAKRDRLAESIRLWQEKTDARAHMWVTYGDPANWPTEQ